jgi:hypothetical protein
MSSDEKTDLRDEDESVEGHRYVADEGGDDDVGKTKTKTRASEDEGDDFGKTKV